MVRASILCWVVVCLFAIAMWIVPTPYKYGLIPIYIVALLIAVRYWNERQSTIRLEESKRTLFAALRNLPTTGLSLAF